MKTRKRRSVGLGRRTKAELERDPQLKEFWTKDLGKDIEASAGLVTFRREKGATTSIVLQPTLVAKLRKKAAAKGIGYQTLLKIIVAEHVDEY